MRPMGPIAKAMRQAAAQQPGSVRELAERAQVGYAAACYTATRMVQRGQLVPLTTSRPVVLQAVDAAESPAEALPQRQVQWWVFPGGADGA
jgi:hypothetical protein